MISKGIELTWKSVGSPIRDLSIFFLRGGYMEKEEF